MSETVTITRAGTPTGGYDDATGLPALGPDVVSDLVIRAFAPRGSDESAEPTGPKVISGGTIYAYPGTVLLASDRLSIRGEAWQVEGELGQWVSPYSSETKGVEIAVKRSP